MYNISNLTKLKRLDENAPDAMKAFWAFDKATFAPGAIDGIHKQLIAVAVALTTQCPYCIELHVQAARKEGATDAMLTEAAIIAAAMRAGTVEERLRRKLLGAATTLVRGKVIERILCG
jgi:AhpD family alkylhydroperoxidase